ncbi:MAG: hypothetical protein HYR96_00155 [Deltaproteobacteria bacterium]|nr:hypothetical protein [Deltaproteobacteria bacterium]MBI3296366.1 hypothetical protein [Deltaproteobacteria bacterium]
MPTIRFPVWTGIAIALFALSLLPLLGITHKEVWGDEILTLIYASGHNSHQLFDTLFRSAKPFTSATLHQFFSPVGSITTIIENLLNWYPLQSAPYYTLLHYWMKPFGNSNAALAALSILFHVASLPACAWFCFELFGSCLTAAIACLFCCLSPLHVYFAQEARPYPLWILIFFLVNAIFLRGLKSRCRAIWILYSALLVLSFYTSLFALPLFAAHALTFFFSWREGSAATSPRRFLFSAGAALLLFSPWLLSFLWNWSREGHLLHQEVEWMGAFSPGTLLQRLGWNALILFYSPRNPQYIEAGEGVNLGLMLPSLLAIVLILIAVVRTDRDEKGPTRRLLLSLVATNLLPLLYWDFATGGIRSAIARYILPSLLAIQIMVARSLARAIADHSIAIRQLAGALLVILTVTQLLWMAQSFQRPDQIDFQLARVKAFLKNEPNSVLLMNIRDYRRDMAQGGWEMIRGVSLAFDLDPSIRVQRFYPQKKFFFPKGKKVFVYDSTESLEHLERLHLRTTAVTSDNLWEVINPTDKSLTSTHHTA